MNEQKISKLLHICSFMAGSVIGIMLAGKL